MISIQEALQILEKNLPEPGIESVDLADAHDRFLAENILAPEPSPRYTNSAMDGYAMRWTDVKEASSANPVKLKIAGESRAGLPYDKKTAAGETIRISTGAMLPPGADTVVRIEDTRSVDDSAVEIFSVHSQGQDIRFEGEEFSRGDQLLSSGTRLSARQLALLASVGHYRVKVFSRPRVAVLITGSELAATGEQEIKPYQIRDSNSIMLQSALQEAGALVHSTSHVADEFQATVEAVTQAVSQKVDFIICSGGISVGDHDHVKAAAETVGFTGLFWRIRQKPGKPLFAASRGRTILFGLPGNPVSAYMCFVHYIRPLLFKEKGLGLKWNTIAALSGGDIVNNGKRTNFIRIKLDKEEGQLPRITDIRKQGSHMLSSIVNGDGYIILEPGAKIQPGETVNVFLF